ncbi:MAG: phosphate signaling complex protein PhoU [Christensenella sp.]|uniref:phosphate signaling complex protein PhoU n=1 Tax=Christensenella sp. TaxID=1935934 RepID=UPI002B2176F3|nr:phosphate signaling complex protein PhoU [Christensenella sp.]MEA5002255.1 phosphate signaling complex protein PhoU [Christensenella sp.]
MRNKFDVELENLNLDLIRMAAMAEDTITKVLCVIEDCDTVGAREIIEDDDTVDAMARQIESRSMKLIMKQQPVAKDLRMISTALKMITDIERICDHAADISEITLTICKNLTIDRPQHIQKMGKTTAQMVHMAVDSYVHRDMELAEQVIELDNEVDRLYDVVKNELLQMAIEDQDKIDQIVDFLMIAKYLERIGDHAENIAEWAMFSETGVHKDRRIL